jgi:hypothetical protein
MYHPFGKEASTTAVRSYSPFSFDGLTLSSGISCSARVPILQQLLHNSFGRLQILARPWPRLPSLVHNAVLTKAKKKIKIDILQEIFYFPLEATQPADPKPDKTVGMHKSSSLASQ